MGRRRIRKEVKEIRPWPIQILNYTITYDEAAIAPRLRLPGSLVRARAARERVRMRERVRVSGTFQ